jgi:hypothetical protein
VSASALHAASVIDRNLPLTDHKLAGALLEPAEDLLRQIESIGIPRRLFWQHAIPLSVGIDSNHELAEVVLRKSLGPSSRGASSVEPLAAAISVLERALRDAVPDLVDQLAVRARPLREQWEAQGPGLLAALGVVTKARLIVPNADVVLVHPVQGGGGSAHLLYNSVCIEAVLVNPVASLPEVVRLGWLLAQLNNDLPAHSESIHGDRLPLISGLAMLPATLQAAQVAELAQYGATTIHQAITAWHVCESDAANLTKTVMQWWSTYMDSRPPWNVALAALNQMLDGFEDRDSL